MKFNPDIHHRCSIRLKEYDYSQAGAYFVTICAHDRECLFGDIIEMTGEHQGEGHSPVINEFGRIVQDEWVRSREIRAEIELGEYVVMPNHFHGIIYIVDDCRGDRPVAPAAALPGPRQKSIGAMLAGFKSSVTKRINETRHSPGVPVWQRNYYEHVIRDDADYNRIAEYVACNPQRWVEDKLHPGNFVVPGGNGNICGIANIVGATGRSPLRNVHQSGECHNRANAITGRMPFAPTDGHKIANEGLHEI